MTNKMRNKIASHLSHYLIDLEVMISQYTHCDSAVQYYSVEMC